MPLVPFCRNSIPFFTLRPSLFTLRPSPFTLHSSLFTIILPPSGREGDHEVVEGAGGYESSGLPCMRCLPLFSLVEAKVSSLLCAFSFRHPCGAGRWGEATAPCSHPGGSRSDSRRRADMESAPTENGKAMGIFSPKQPSNFAVRRNITPKAHHFPLAENITRRRRISLCNRRRAVAPWGTAKRWKEPAGTKATICLL